MGGNGNITTRGGFGEEPSQLNNFAYYSQYDDRWKSSKYDLSSGHSATPTLSARGCGPTSMAMVATQLTGKRYEPTQMAKIAQDGGYSTNDGTTWGYFNKIAKDFSLDMKNINPSNTLEYLNYGMPVILSGKRTQYSENDSPFTPSGHYVVVVGKDANGNVLINDPRGPKYSKSYDINKVNKEAVRGWAFNYNGGQLPEITNSTTTSRDKLSVIEALTKMNEAFALFSENVRMGTNKKLSWDNSNNTPTDSGTNISSSTIDFIPKNLQEAIIKKTLDLTVGSESSGNYAVAKNDIDGATRASLSPSIGILQWREGNAKRLMEKIYEHLPNNKEADYFANKVNWSNRSPWDNSSQQRLRDFLQNNLDIVKKVQNEMAFSFIRDTDLAPVYKYGVDTGKIKDPRSIVFLGDFANTGPALIKPFLEKYKPNNSGDEFEHFMSEFKSKSWWANHMNIYGGRVKNNYSNLVGWKPEIGGLGDREKQIVVNNKPNLKLIKGGLGELTSPTNTSNQHLINYNRELFKTTPNDSNVSSYINMSNNTNKYSDISLQEVVSLLREIALNTNNTSKGIDEMLEKEIIVNVTTVSNNIPDINETGTNINIQPQESKATFVSPFFQSMNENITGNKEQRNYNIAKKIASGGI